MTSLTSFRLPDLNRAAKLVLSLALVMIGVGYLIALFNLYETYHLVDGDPALGASDLKRAFYGNRDNTRLAAKIHGGSMEQFLPRPGDKEKILSWIQDGASEESYLDPIRPILSENCLRCHNPEGVSKFRPLTSYQEVMTVVQIDRGEPVALWARVAHTHVQSLALVFAFLGLLFSASSFPELAKLIILPAPFLGLLADFGARLLAKYYPGLVYAVMAMGVVVGLSMAIMILFPLYEMWFTRRSRA